MNLLAIKNLSLSIGDTQILQDINVAIAPGEIVAITGESGSGKSITALTVMGLLPRGAQANGTVTLEGTDILTTPEPALCEMRGNVCLLYTSDAADE